MKNFPNGNYPDGQAPRIIRLGRDPAPELNLSIWLPKGSKFMEDKMSKSLSAGSTDRACDGCDEPQGDGRWFEIDSVKGLCWRCCNLEPEQRPNQLAGRMGK